MQQAYDEKQTECSERRLALVIGVNTSCPSLLPPLPHAISDAQAMAVVLQQHCHFEVFESMPLLGQYATSDAIKKAIRAFARVRTDDDFLLLYFSGHALPLSVDAGREAVYLGSADLDPQDVKEDENAHISFQWIREVLFEKTQAGRVLLMLDCCFAGDIARTTSDHYLEELRQRIRYYFEAPSADSQARRGGLRVALTATGHGQPAYEGRAYGLMTGYLLPALSGDIPDALETVSSGALS
jgi:uncharacterized caspase-like protein